MPSFAASLAGFLLRTTGYYRRMFSGGPQFEKNIAKIRSAPLPSPKAHADIDIRHSEFQGRPVWHLAPKDRAPTAHVLFWHGGGYVYPATDVHWKFLSRMASVHGWSVTAPLYPLAPEIRRRISPIGRWIIIPLIWPRWVTQPLSWAATLPVAA